MANVVKMTIQFRRDYSANWEKYKDVVPAAGEPCFVLDKNILKIGDGVTTFEHLEPINGVKCEFNADNKSLVLEDNILKLMGFDAAEAGAQPRKNADGFIEWVIPNADEKVDELLLSVDILRNDVGILQTEISDLRDIVGSSDDGSSTLLTRIESLETKVDGVDAKIKAEFEAFASNLTDDGKVNTLMELINYVESHGEETANMASDIKTLHDLVGNTSVNEQILAIVNTSGHIVETKANAVFEHVKYEVSHKPEGALADYRDKEIRVMCPTDTKWVKQNVGTGGNGSMYYIGLKAYAPDGAMSFKEDLAEIIADNTMYYFDGNDFAGVDVYGPALPSAARGSEDRSRSGCRRCR